MLTNMGLMVDDLFSKADTIEDLADRSEVENFSRNLEDTKNIIYQNIYNNLSYIYKSKGTEKSFRNLIRCFGVDEELIKLNLYTSNTTFTLDDSFRAAAVRKNFVDFNDVDRFHGTVFQCTSSNNPNSISYISASVGSTTGISEMATIEAEVLLPRKMVNTSNISDKVYFPYISSSLFGMHGATASAPGSTAWPLEDYGNFQVFAVRKDYQSALHPDEDLVRFELSGTAGTYFPTLTSSFFNGVYDNSRWNLAVKIYPTDYPNADIVEHVSASSHTYTVELYGVNSDANIIKEQFSVTGTMPYANGAWIFERPRKVFAGAHRVDHTGSILHFSDARVAALRYWMDNISNDAINAHSYDAANFGTFHPHKSSYSLQSKFKSVDIPQSKTLILNWDFETVTGSNAEGKFVVEDASSGSIDGVLGYGALGPIINRQHTGQGSNFCGERY